MKIKFLIALAFSVAGVLFLVENAHAQKLKQFSKMYETEIPGYGLVEYGKTNCIDLPRQKRVCKSAQTETGDFEILIQENKKTVKKIKSSVGSFTNKFWVYQGNLDKSRSDEVVIVDYNGSSNGLGVSYNSVYIFSNTIEKGFQTPLEFPIEEFGEKDNFILDKKNNETLILATEWDGHRNFDSKRGWGLYLMGRWFRLRNGKLKPASDKPILARRYTFGFQRERLDTLDYEHTHRPYRWLQNRATHKFYPEPMEKFELLSKHRGTVEKYEEYTIDDKDGREFTVRTIDGEKIICRFGFPYSTTDKEYEGKVSIGDFGLLPAGFIFPSNFSPLAIFEKLEGKRVQVEIYKDDWGKNFSYFWILEK